MAGVRVSEVVAGISGSHIRSLNSHGMVAIRDKEVTEFDLDAVMDAAKAMLSSDQDILHVLPIATVSMSKKEYGSRLGCQVFV